MERLLRGAVDAPVAHAGILTREQLIGAGYDDMEVRRLVRKGVWRRVRRGIYVPTTLWTSLDPIRQHVLQTRAALLRVEPPAAASHTSAGAVHGLDMLEPDLSLVHVTRAGLRSSRIQAGISHHIGQLDADDLTEIDGIAVTSAARTAIDLARLAPFEAGVVVADSALRRGVGREHLLSKLIACAEWPGSRTARRVLAFADGRSESVGESLARLTFAEQGLPPPELQVQFWRTNGALCARVDFAFLDEWTVAEFDGKLKYHRGLADNEDPGEIVWREKKREDELREEFGFEVVRVTWHDMDPRRRHHLAGRIRAAFARAAEHRRRMTGRMDVRERVIVRPKDAA